MTISLSHFFFFLSSTPDASLIVIAVNESMSSVRSNEILEKVWDILQRISIATSANIIDYN